MSVATMKAVQITNEQNRAHNETLEMRASYRFATLSISNVPHTAGMAAYLESQSMQGKAVPVGSL